MKKEKGVYTLHCVFISLLLLSFIFIYVYHPTTHNRKEQQYIERKRENVKNKPFSCSGFCLKPKKGEAKGV